MMNNEFTLKYGCNPNQHNARLYMEDSEKGLPFSVLNGRPGYINFLDALNGYQLVTELKAAVGLPAAASFKHVSPAGVGIGKPLTEELKKVYFAESYELSPLACAYARARGCDRVSSYGDWVALSDTCDVSTAKLIACEVSDGIIAPGYDKDALEILKSKRRGNYNIVEIDAGYKPQPLEHRQVYGITFEQERNSCLINKDIFKNIITNDKNISQDALTDLLIATVTLKYTQSNSVCYAFDGQTIGIGAGQQSRIACTRIAGDKADKWFLRQHPKVLSLDFVDGVKRPDKDNAIDTYISGYCDELFDNDMWRAFFKTRPLPLNENEKHDRLAAMKNIAVSSDAFFPFSDNIERLAKSGVKYVAEPGGSIRDDAVIKACNDHGMTLIFTNLRLFHH